MHVVGLRVLLRPTDFDRSVAFYEQDLGLVRYREWGATGHRGVVFFLGGGYLELSEGGAHDPPRGVRLWLQVGDLRAVHGELLGKGIAVLEAPQRKPWGLDEMVVADPDGLPLIIVETPPEHPLRRDTRS